ncbi:MAG TPA: alpha/beta hydrolase [Chryseosolibacter sp.]
MRSLVLLLSLMTATFSVAQTSATREAEFAIGGIRQYVTISGGDRTLPLLLFLHGGPGGSVMNYADKFTDRLRQHFIVIQWDQRETGRTRELNSSPIPLSLALFESDTRALIDTLLHRFGREKLYLAGHSWGTALGFDIARKYPDRLYAFIAIGPMINQLESERISLSMMKERARKAGNRQETEELAGVNIPFADAGQLYFHRKWLSVLSGSRRTLSESYVKDWSATWLPVFNEASKENLMKTLPEIGCPVYFFLGKNDYQTNSAIAEAYYNFVKAPKKGLFWFDCAHSIPSAQPERMQKIIIETVLPETFPALEKNVPLPAH